jgi:hypothetical protein
MTEQQKLISKLQDLFPVGPPAERILGWGNPPLDVLNCVLSLHRPYYSFCYPRVEKFSNRHRDVQSLQALLSLIQLYQSPLEFSTRELDYRDEARAEILVGVLNYLLAAQLSFEGDSVEERLRKWAESSKPQDYALVGVSGFALSGFQYLRMLLGAQATKPDVYIRRFVSAAVGYKVSDVKAQSLLEEACGTLKWPLSDLDYTVRETLARGTGSEDNWTYRLEVDGRPVRMPEQKQAEVEEQGRCLYAVLPKGTRIEYRCVQLNKNGDPYRSWPIPKPRDLGARTARGQEIALQYGLLT